MPAHNLQGRRALVTGGAGGIGLMLLFALIQGLLLSKYIEEKT